MTAILHTATRPILQRGTVRPGTARGVMLGVLLLASAAGVLAASAPPSSEAAARAGADLTNLLRFMAVLKACMALLAGAALMWRLGAAVSSTRLVAYAAAAACMAAGPGLIWGMAHVGLGALLLHGGLLATGMLLWFDPATAAVLERAVARQRWHAGRGARPASLAAPPRPTRATGTPAAGAVRR